MRAGEGHWERPKNGFPVVGSMRVWYLLTWGTMLGHSCWVTRQVVRLVCWTQGPER
ncbi:hypothetical protein PGB90_008662 [Kerria lacca]